jgi:hypothetical protein
MKRALLALCLLAILLAIATPIALAASPQAGGCPGGPFDENGEPREPAKCECNNMDVSDANFCMSGFASVGYMVRDMIRVVFLGMQKGLARFLWLLMRIVVIVCDALLRGEIWENIRDTVLDQLEKLLGGRNGVIYQVIGPNTGLFTVALMLAGLLMILPAAAANTSQLVKPERVLTWGVFVMILFVSSSTGFDLIAAIEDLRVNVMQVASGMTNSNDSTNNLVNLVASPMLATPEEALNLDIDSLRTLPKAFEERYFPEVKYEPRRAIVLDNPGEALDLIFRVEVMTDAEYLRVIQSSNTALFWILLSSISLYVLTLLAMIYVGLFAAALALIIFFLAAIPLGFFEFGSNLLMGIVRQYVAIVAISLFASVFVRLLTETTLATMSADLDFSRLGLYVGTQILVAVLLTMVLNLTWRVMDGSLGVMGHSLSTVSAMAYATQGPMGATTQAAKTVTSTAVTAATGAAAGLVTGGIAGALFGGVGGMLSTSQAGGNLANFVANQAAPGDSLAHTLAAAARSGGSPIQAATGIIATRPRPVAGSGKGAVSGGYNETPPPAYDNSHKLNPKWQAVDMGGYLTSDLSALERAERAFFQEKNPDLARRHLVGTYGNRAVADEVMGIYQQQGPQGAMWVRGVTETAQLAAQNTQQAGERVFDGKGQQSDAFRMAVGQEFDQNHLTSPDDPNLPTARRIVNATVRKPTSVWRDPNQAPRQMAQDTLDPASPEVQVGDTSAQYALRDLAVREGWDKPEQQHKLDHVFRSFQAVTMSTPPERVQPEQVYEQMTEDPTLRYTHPDTLREAARLVTLVGRDAEVQHGPDDPDRTINVRHRESLEDDFVFSAPYSADFQQHFQDEVGDDAEWDAEAQEWHVKPASEAMARQMLLETSEEQGWAVRYDSPADAGGLPAPEREARQTTEPIHPSTESAPGTDLPTPTMGYSSVAPALEATPMAEIPPERPEKDDLLPIVDASERETRQVSPHELARSSAEPISAPDLPTPTMGYSSSAPAPDTLPVTETPPERPETDDLPPVVDTFPEAEPAPTPIAPVVTPAPVISPPHFAQPSAPSPSSAVNQARKAATPPTRNS